MKKIFILIVLFFLAALTWTIPNQAASNSIDASQWSDLTPLELLDLLKKENEKGRRFYVIAKTKKGWVQEKYIPSLIGLLDDTTPCANVMLLHSSHIGPVSTVGHEAAFLIYGFRMGHYPPELNSSRWVSDKENILEWWQQFQSTKD
jgi:hypothetical protein